MKKLILFSIAISCFSIGCANKSASSNEEIDTPVSGKINVSVDETLTPIALAEADIFQHHYEKVHIISHHSKCKLVLFLIQRRMLSNSFKLVVENLSFHDYVTAEH